MSQLDIDKAADAHAIRTADSVQEAGEYYKNLRDAYYHAKALADRLEARKAAAMLVLYERMGEEQTPSFKRTGVGRFTRNEPTWYAQIQDLDALVAWAEQHRPGMVRKVAAQKLANELVREYERDGRLAELPPGIGAFPKRTVSVHKA